MAEPKIRFCKEDGTSYSSWQKMKLDEIFVERTTTQTLSDDAPQLSFTIEDGVINPEDKKTNKRDFLMKDKDTKKFALTEYNDIIYNPANLKFGAIHRNKLGRGCVSPIYAIFHTETQLPEFMELVVRDPDFIKRSLRYLEGTVEKLKSLKPRDFLQMEVSVPCLEEQQKIASFFADLDEVIQTSEAEVAALEKQKKGAMQKIFSQEVRFKMDDGGDYPEWESKKLQDICIDFIVPMRDKPKEFVGTIPWCRIEDIEGKYFITSKSGQFVDEETVKKMNLKIYPEGTVICSCSASLGTYAIAKRPLITNQTFIGLVCGNSIINHFLYYYMSMQTVNIKKIADGTSILYVSRDKFEQLPIVLPCLEEQQKIADFLSDFDTAIDLAKQELEKWKLLKKGLMQQMFV